MSNIQCPFWLLITCFDPRWTRWKTKSYKNFKVLNLRKGYKAKNSFFKPFGKKIMFNGFKMFSFRYKSHAWLSIETHFGIFCISNYKPTMLNHFVKMSNAKWFKVLWKHDMTNFNRSLTMYVGNNIWDKYSSCWTWINFGFFALHFCVQLIYLINFDCKSCFDNESFVYIFQSCVFYDWKNLYYWIDFEIANDTPFST
jgi:hypothetical protein